VRDLAVKFGNSRILLGDRGFGGSSLGCAAEAKGMARNVLGGTTRLYVQAKPGMTQP